MANYNDLKTGIDAVIKTNGRQEISGAALNTQLKNMIAELGAGYQYMGMATPATNPGTPDANVFYLASEAGTYTNFGGIVINEGEVCALVWNGTWAKQVTGAATADQLNQLGQQVNDELFDYNKDTQLSIVSEESGKGLNANGTLFDNSDYITCSYDVVEGNSYYITGRQPGAGSAVACAYDSNGNFIKAYTYTPSTNIVDALIAIPLGASILKVCISGIVSNPNKRPSVYNATKSSRTSALKKTTESIYNKQQRNVFLTGGGKFHIEETRIAGGVIYFNYTNNLQFFEKNGTAINLKDFATIVSLSGLETVTSPSGETCIVVGGGKVLVINISNKRLEIVNFADLTENDIVLLCCVAGRVSFANDEIIVDLIDIDSVKGDITTIKGELSSVKREITTINTNFTTELFSFEKDAQLSIVSEESGKGLNADGTFFDNVDFITCSYNVVGGNYYYITGRQPGASSAVACAYDSNGNFIWSYVYTPSTDIVDALISIPVGASILKVCIDRQTTQPTKRPSVYSTTETSKIDTLENEITTVPNYWISLLETKEASIIGKMGSIGYNGDCFVFITDIHWDSFNFGKSPILIKHILDNTSISNIFIGGDVAQNGTISETIGFVGNIKKFTDRMFATPGNHDVSLSQFYSIFGKLAENYTDTKKSTDYYLDNVSQKIRYIFLTTTNGNTAISQSQVTFLNNCVSSLDSGWTIFVLTHIIWHAANIEEDPQITVCGQSVMDAVDGMAENTQATIAAIICGHLHRDWDGQTTGGIKVIGTTCDANGGQAVYDPVTPTRTAGTTSEQCFDVFSIDTTNKKIYITRIGGNGVDREFTY